MIKVKCRMHHMQTYTLTDLKENRVYLYLAEFNSFFTKILFPITIIYQLLW